MSLVVASSSASAAAASSDKVDVATLTRIDPSYAVALLVFLGQKRDITAYRSARDTLGLPNLTVIKTPYDTRTFDDIDDAASHAENVFRLLDRERLVDAAKTHNIDEFSIPIKYFKLLVGLAVWFDFKAGYDLCLAMATAIDVASGGGSENAKEVKAIAKDFGDALGKTEWGPSVSVGGHEKSVDVANLRDVDQHYAVAFLMLLGREDDIPAYRSARDAYYGTGAGAGMGHSGDRTDRIEKAIHELTPVMEKIDRERLVNAAKTRDIGVFAEYLQYYDILVGLTLWFDFKAGYDLCVTAAELTDKARDAITGQYYSTKHQEIVASNARHFRSAFKGPEWAPRR